MEPVSTIGGGDFGRELNLETVIEALDQEFGITYDFHSDSMVTFRLDSSGPALTLYRTGKYQIRGTKTCEELFQANEKLFAALQSIGVESISSDFEQQNAVFLDDLETKVQLESLVVLLGLESTEYEPEQFPGVVYRPSKIGTVMLIFASGKTIISGTTHEKQARRSFEHLKSKISQIEN